MRPHQAYQQHQQSAMPRIDLIIALYRKAMDRLDRAGLLLAAQNPDAARSLLAETHLIVSSLSAGMVGSTDAATTNFLRLYEFVAHKLALGTIEDIAAARKVLTPLLEGFEAVRDQAVAMEIQGVIPSLNRERQIQLTV